MPGRGWMPGAVEIPTSFFGYSDIERGHMEPIAVVNHIAQGFIRTIDGWARAGTTVSPHFGITRGGAVHQYVSIFDAGYHAGRLDPGRPPTWPGYQQGRNPNKYTVGIEFEGFAVHPGYAHDYIYSDERPWPEAMVEAGIRVHQWIFSQIDATPSVESVIGHREIAPASRAHDPGPQWPQARILAALADGGAALSPELDLDAAIAAVIDAYSPTPQHASFQPQPLRGDAAVYEVVIRGE